LIAEPILVVRSFRKKRKHGILSEMSPNDRCDLGCVELGIPKGLELLVEFPF
jgi:hypothetical protein